MHFDAPAYALEIDVSVLGSPLPAADPTLRAVLEAHARTLAERVPDGAGLAPRVRRLLHDALHGGKSDLASIAKALGTSTRTLQRRLREEGTSHDALLDEERARLARHYVARSGLSLQEIAFMLGFHDQAGFHRAFVRWTGQTPGGHRAEATARP